MTLAATLGRLVALAALAMTAACAPGWPRPGAPLAPGRHHAELAERGYDVHVPGSYDGSSEVPLVVAIHGAFSNPRKMARETGWSTLAEREGFVVLYPGATGLLGLLRYWNSGHCCGHARARDVDDVGDVMATIQEVCRRLRIDPRRVYLVGHSNGGMLVHRIAAERSGAFAAAAVVSGTIGGKPSGEEPEWRVPPASRPVPMMMIHGRADPRVLYEGGRSRREATMISVARSASFWVEQNRLDPRPVQSRPLEGVLEELWPGENDVLLVTLDDWGHEWPGAELTSELPEGHPLRGFDATERIWEFLRSHRAP